MNEEKTLETLLSVIDKYKGSDGWTDLAVMGSPLNKVGLNYKALGYFKLKELIETFEDKIELKKDVNSHKVPIVYARKRSNGNKAKVKPTIYKTKDTRADTLMAWAWMGDFGTVINNLKNLALKERWFYNKQNPSFPYPILSKYLTYTFFRLYKEGNKIKNTENYASFNTGLVNNLYEPIYALFEKNRNEGRQEWFFLGFCVSGVGRLGKLLVSTFNPLPERAHYFSNPSELIYDINAQEPQLNWNHIILDNINRLPIDFLNENKPSNFLLQDVSNMSTLDKANYYSTLAHAIESDSKIFRAIKNRFSDSLDLALKRVEWNFKTAIPMYYPPNNQMSLLLPLSLIDDDVIDLALVTEKTSSGNYLGHTILPLDWAYSNARLITRPDSDWLIADKIEVEQLNNIDDDDELLIEKEELDDDE